MGEWRTIKLYGELLVELWKMDYTGYFQCGISLNRTLIQSVAWAGGNFHLETLDD